MTKGHFHLRETAEIYFCLSGQGYLLTQNNQGEVHTVQMNSGVLGYIPPGWGHRTLNTGPEEFVFLAVYPADAGHNYRVIEEKGFAGTNIGDLSARTGETEEVIKRFLKTIGPSVLISEDQAHVAWKKSLYEAADRIVAFLKAFHAEHPLSPGVPRQEIYGRFLPALAATLFQKLLSELEDKNLIAVRGANVLSYGYSPKMNFGHQEFRGQLESLFEHAFPGKNSPGIKTVLSLPGLGKEGRDVFYHMLSSGDLLRITEDFIVTPEQMQNVINTMREAFSPGLPFQVGEFKDLFNISRKHAIPLLEYLDREGITKRSGNYRAVIEN